MPESTIYGLGSGRLGAHTTHNWRKEYVKVQNELAFLKIKSKGGKT